MKPKIVSILGICLILADIAAGMDCPSTDKQPELIPSLPTYADEHNVEETGFTITCKAAYPVEWDFDGYLEINNPIVKRTISIAPDNSTCYKSVFHTSLNDAVSSFSGKFSCFSISDPGKRASFYKFHTGSDSEIFSHSLPRKVNLARKTKRNQYVIPCKANYERANVTLVKVLSDDDEITLPMGTNLTYDPQVGFMLKANAFPDPVGKYKCLGTYGSNKYRKDYVDEAEIEIAATDATVSFTPETNFAYFQNNSLRLTCESVNEIYLDTTRVPAEIIVSVSNAPISGSKFRYSYSILIKSTGTSKGQVTCHQKDTNAQITTWRFDEADRCRCIWDNWSRSRQKKNPDDPYGIFVCSPGISIYEDFYTCDNPSECRLRACPNENNCRLKNWGYFLQFGAFTSQLSAGYLNCEVERLSKPKMSPGEVKKFQNKIDNIYIQFENLITVDTLGYQTVLRVGDSQTFNCKIHSNYLVEEIRWGLKFKNGSFSYLENPNGQLEVGTTGVNQYELEITKVIEITDVNLEWVYCFGSAWETGEIKNASVKIFVQEQLETVDDPKKTHCAGLSDNPSIFLKSNNPSGGYKWHNVTGKDVVSGPLGETTYFVCMSKHLTEWVFDSGNSYVYTPSSGTTKEVIRLENSDGKELCFLSSTFFYGYAYEIGNYTCREVRHHGVETSVYLFAKDPNFHLIAHGTHSNITIDKNQEWTHIPCTANDPGANVHLIRQDYAGNLQDVPDDPSFLLPYDPKKGFFIKTHLLLMEYNATDVYICSSVFKGAEELESNHVRSFGIGEVTDGHDHLSGDPEAEEASRNDGYSLGAILTPWIIVIIFLAFNVCLFLYARRLRQRLMESDQGNAPTIYMNQVNKDPPVAAPASSEQQHQQSGSTKPGQGHGQGTSSSSKNSNGNSARDENGGIVNPGYVKFS